MYTSRMNIHYLDTTVNNNSLAYLDILSILWLSLSHQKIALRRPINQPCCLTSSFIVSGLTAARYPSA